MSRRMVALLAVLATLVGILTVQHWPKAAKASQPPPTGSLSVDDLVAGMDDNVFPWRAIPELAQRGWLGGPDVIEPLFSHPDPAVRRLVRWLGPPSDVRVSPYVADEWRDRLVRLMQRDADEGVRECAALLLVLLVRDEHLAPIPRLETRIGQMIRSDDERTRSRGCMFAMYLGEHARSLVPEILAIDFGRSQKDRAARSFVCTMLGNIGEANEAATEYLLVALQDEETSVRQAAASALGAIGGGDQRVATALAGCWRDERGPKDLRTTSLTALTRLDLPKQEARELLLEVLPARSLFESDSPGVDDAAWWAALVARFAVAADDADAQRSAIDALRAGFRVEPQEFGTTARTAAIARIAVALRDTTLVEAALPDLLDGLEFDRSDWPMVEAQKLELVLEALVDVCRWRNDGPLRNAVEDALSAIVDRGDHSKRDWARALRQRLRS